MRVQQWSYKGLFCEIIKHKKGYTASVSDIGVITNKQLPLIYKGGPKKIDRHDLEKEIDDFLKSCGQSSKHCSYYGTAVVFGFCYLRCGAKGCIFNGESKNEK